MAGKIILTFVTVTIAAIFFQKIYEITHSKTSPKLNTNSYWGPGNVTEYREDTAIKPFQIVWNSNDIKSLKSKLSEPIDWFPKPLDDTVNEYGINVHELQSFVEYWRDSYLPRWQDRLDFLNSMPHFRTQIQGLQVHFIHSKPPITHGKKVLPLLLLHGWPGSVREFYELIPMLTTNVDNDFVFEVIAPSIPGYAWSDPSAKKDLGPTEIAVVFRNLMQRLGHSQFIIQGGDWGSIIGYSLATLFPDNVLAYHSNFCVMDTPLAWIKWYIASWWPTKFIDTKYVDFVYPIQNKVEFLMEQMGYLHLQATRPDTIGIALTRNPIGLTAYLLEKYSMAFLKYDNDAILDNIMIYYLTDSITSSVRLYAEGFSKKTRAYDLHRVPIAVPTACARYKRDLLHLFDWQLQEKYTNLVQSTWYTNGGHFVAWETPELLYNDFISFINKVF